MRWNPALYNQTKQHRIKLFQNLLHWANIQTLDNKRILDIGCGDGAIDRFVVEHSNDVNIVAIDSDPNMIQYAVRYHSHENLLFKVMQAEAIVDSRQFDMVLSLSCLHWVKDQKKVLSGIHTILNDHGTVLLLICPEQPYVWMSLNEIIARPFWQNYFKQFNHGYYFYNECDYQELAENAGFQIEKIEQIYAKLNHIETQEAFENLIAGWIPHLARLPEKLHKRFLKETSDDVLKKMQQDGLKDFAEYEGALLHVYLTKNRATINC